MPSTVEQRYAEWMASPPSAGRLVEGVKFTGNARIGLLAFARGIFEPSVLPDEHGDMLTWSPANFELELPNIEASLDQTFRLVFDGLSPDFARRYDRLPPESTYAITYVRLYSWLVPGGTDAPMITPPPKLSVTEIKMSATTLELVCSGPVLPRKRAGRVYTIEEFPGLSTE